MFIYESRRKNRAHNCISIWSETRYDSWNYVSQLTWFYSWKLLPFIHSVCTNISNSVPVENLIQFADKETFCLIQTLMVTRFYIKYTSLIFSDFISENWFIPVTHSHIYKFLNHCIAHHHVSWNVWNISIQTSRLNTATIPFFWLITIHSYQSNEVRVWALRLFPLWWYKFQPGNPWIFII